MISLRVVDESTHHVLIQSDERISIETQNVGDRPIIHVYRINDGADDNDEDMVGCYDGTIQGNKNWEV
jgi:hypothetical protein